MSDSVADILIVEDNPNDAELVARVLRKSASPNVTFVRNGAEALDFLFAEGEYEHRSINDAPCVILLDLKLPKVDGIEVLRRIKGDKRTRTIPVVILTSSTEERDLQAAYDLGANSYVTKPIEFQDLADVVAEVGHYWLTANRLPAQKR